MKNKINVLVFFALLLLCGNINGQSFLRKYKAETGVTELNYYEVTKWANEHFKELEAEFMASEEGFDGQSDYKKYHSYLSYKRWQWYWESQVKPDGSFPTPLEVADEVVNEKSKARLKSASAVSASWNYIGMTGNHTGYWGAGRVDAMAFHPTDPNAFWAGGQIGGIWKTTDGGQNYVQIGDNLPYHGVSSLAVDPLNPDVLYVACAPSGGYNGLGIYKTINGGNTWEPTGLTTSHDGSRNYYKVMVSPENANEVFACTNVGLYRSSNAGDTWSVIRSGNCINMVFKPGDASTIYAIISGNVYKTTNSGSNWTQISSYGNTQRIAVTQANSNFIMIQNGDENVYSSTDEGGSWTFKSAAPQLVQIGISQTDQDLIHVGNFVIHQSTDGGATWNQKTNWAGGTSYPIIHADVRFMGYHPANPDHVYFGTDGGVCRYVESQDTYTELNNGLEIAQLYSIAVCEANPDVILYGTQDNGGATKLANGTWQDVFGGDCMETAFDPTNPRLYYGTYISQIYRRDNDVQTNIRPVDSDTEGGNWVTPYMLDPNDPNTIVVGLESVWLSTNKGDSWRNIGENLAGGNNLNEIAMSRANSNVIYISQGSRFYATSDLGNNWSQTHTFSGSITGIAASNADANHVWVTVGGYVDGAKVYESTDGGATWTNISGTLPNIPLFCIIYQNNSNDDLYIGTRIGVYYKNADMNDWEYYNQGLPPVDVRDLAIHYGTSKLRAGTYGRGVWETPLVSTGSNREVISWSSAILSDASDVSTEGDFVEAVNFGGGADASAYNTTINGVSFSGLTNGADGTNVWASPSTTYLTANSGNVYQSTDDIYATADGGLSVYDNLLSQAIYDASGADNQITLSGLTIGTTYQVQLFMADTRATEAGRYITMDSGTSDEFGDNSTGLYTNDDAAAGLVITGTFRAIATEIQFTIDKSNSTGLILSAYQLRDVTPAPSSIFTWSGKVLTGESDVLNLGKLVEAYNFGGGSNPSALTTTINGVKFTGRSNGDSSNSWESPTFGRFSANSGNVTQASGDLYTVTDGGLEAFDNLLSQALWDESGADNQITLSNLTPGTEYKIQLFFGDNRSSQDGMYITMDAEKIGAFGDATTCQYTSTEASTGLVVESAFTPYETEISFTIDNSNGEGLILNAYQLRDMSPPSIFWSGSLLTGIDDISTKGTLIEAINFSGGINVSNYDETINGVTFKGLANGDEGNIWINPSATYFSANSRNVIPSDVDIYTEIDGGLSDYDDLLSRGLWDSGSGYNEITLKGLIPGKEYQVQLFLGDNRSNQEGRYVTLDQGKINEYGGEVNGVYTPTTGAVGRQFTGLFEANDTLVSFTLNKNDQGLQLNAYQLREVTSPEEDHIVWSGSFIVEEEDVSTEGTLVEAINFSGGTNASNYDETINGVSFKGLTNGDSNNGWVRPVSNNFSATSRNVIPSTVDIYTTSDGGLSTFDNLLSRSLWDKDAAYNEITLSGLVVGNDYLVQLFVGDNRSNQSGKYITVDQGRSNQYGGEIDGLYTQIAGATGLQLTGRFTANSTTKTFTLNKNGQGLQLNAYQIRDLTPIVTSISNTINKKKVLVVYPNPADDYFVVEAGYGDNTLEIFDINGKLVYNDVFTDRIRINSSGEFLSGIYLIRVYNSKGVFAGKLIIK